MFEKNKKKKKKNLVKTILPNFHPLCSCNFMQKIRKFNASFCYKTQKTHFGPLFV